MRKFFYFSWLILLMMITHVDAADERLTSEYKLSPGDLIKISVLNEENLSMEVRLTDGGIISYPFLGEVKASGLTLRELEILISNGLNGSYLVDPKVNVNITEFRKIFIGGQVRAPGGYPYTPGLTVQKAVAIAGGFTERASNDITVIHEDDTSHMPRELDLYSPVQPGDVITVEESFF
jgi:protein involved in polysaccharide export with SLBB domain